MRKINININKNWLALGAALLLGGASFVMGSMYLTDREKQLTSDLTAANKQVMISAIVPTVDLKPGDTLSTEILSVRDVPADLYPVNAIFGSAQLGLIEGQKVTWPVARGVPIQPSHIDPSGKAFSALIEKGYRAVTLMVDELNSSSGMLIPGNHVDLLLVVQENDSEQIRPLLEDITVIATGQEASAVKKVEFSDTDANKTYNTITVMLDPEKSARLLLAQSVGTIKTVLRGNSDRVITNPRVVTSDMILGKGQSSSAPKKVEMIIGGMEAQAGASYSNVLGGAGGANQMAAMQAAMMKNMAVPATPAKADASTATHVGLK